MQNPSHHSGVCASPAPAAATARSSHASAFLCLSVLRAVLMPLRRKTASAARPVPGPCMHRSVSHALRMRRIASSGCRTASWGHCPCRPFASKCRLSSHSGAFWNNANSGTIIFTKPIDPLGQAAAAMVDGVKAQVCHHTYQHTLNENCYIL